MAKNFRSVPGGPPTSASAAASPGDSRRTDWLSGEPGLRYTGHMLLWITFGFGTANFYMHRAVMEGDGPMFAEIAATVRRIGGRYGGYILEFALLVAALWFVRQGSTAAALLYGGYTVMNVTGYQLIRILERR